MGERRLYALKWGVFVKWCCDAHIDPAACSMSDVLCFLQYRLDSGSLPSTLKVYVATIASFHSLLGGQSIGRHALVVGFLKASRRLYPVQDLCFETDWPSQNIFTRFYKLDVQSLNSQVLLVSA